jgi:hypothetical protein
MGESWVRWGPRLARYGDAAATDARIRPGHIGGVIPYLSIGIGVNINTDNVQDSFAWRTAGGLDYALGNWIASAPKGLMLNTEVAWKRNHVNIGEGSAISLLFGIRYTFH